MDGSILEFKGEGGGGGEGGRGGKEEKRSHLTDFLEFRGEVGERGEERAVVREKEGFLRVLFTEGGEPVVGEEEGGRTNERGVVDALVGGGGGRGGRGGRRGGRGGRGELEVKEAVSLTEENDFVGGTRKDLGRREGEGEGREGESGLKRRGERSVISLGGRNKEKGGEEGGGRGGRRRRGGGGRRWRGRGRRRRRGAIGDVGREDRETERGGGCPYFSIF